MRWSLVAILVIVSGCTVDPDGLLGNSTLTVQLESAPIGASAVEVELREAQGQSISVVRADFERVGQKFYLKLAGARPATLHVRVWSNSTLVACLVQPIVEPTTQPQIAHADSGAQCELPEPSVEPDDEPGGARPDRGSKPEPEPGPDSEPEPGPESEPESHGNSG